MYNHENCELDMSSTGTPTIPWAPTFDGSFDQAVALEMVATYAQVASSTLLTHDILLNLPREIRLVWQNARWGVAHWLYVLTRYLPWIQAFVTLVPLLDYHLDGAECKPWKLFQEWGIPIIMALVEATLTLRVLAMWGNNRIMMFCLWSWYLLNITTMFTLMGFTLQQTTSLPSPAPPALGCILNNKHSYLWELYVPALVFETTVAGLTLLKAIQLKWILSNTRTPLLYVLVRDGFWYFFVVFALMLVNLIICLVLSTVYHWTPQISTHIASVMAVRLFLNLRETAKPSGLSTIGIVGPQHDGPIAKPGETSCVWTAQTSQDQTGV